jgi:ATP/maltotriose-dependent transcriptional regulator MalT
MSEATLLSIAFLLICVMFIMLLIAFTKIINIQKRLADVSPKDLYPFMEELRELVIESERIADKLEDSISKKEDLLEDISTLAEDKLRRLESIKVPDEKPILKQYYAMQQKEVQPQAGGYSQEPLTMRDRIAELIRSGLPDTEIASRLGISTTEVQIVRKLDIA